MEEDNDHTSKHSRHKNNRRKSHYEVSDSDYSQADSTAAPSSGPDIPPGLETLATIGKVLVKQELELIEIFCHCEGKNRYSIRDDHGREFMKAAETTCCCYMRCCCWHNGRPFNFTVDDFDGHEIYFDRKISCNTCFVPCCLNRIKVTMKNYGTLGYVKQRWSLCDTSFNIRNGNGDKVLKIFGPCCTTSCCCSDVTFSIYDMDGNTVGEISKKWGGIIKEALTDTDSFAVVFPKDLDVKIKAVLLAAAILIDFMFFENTKPKT